MLYITLLALAASISAADGRKIVDLTHTLDEHAPKYPISSLEDTATNFSYYALKPLMKQYIGDMWVELNTLEFYEHQGTHIDAPIHFGNGRQTLDEIPLNRLMGPGVVIDIKDKVKDNADYAVTVEDIKMHEAEYGRIPPNAIITINSGWARKYPDPNMVFGTKNLDDPKTFHFPGWSLEACEFMLQQRQVAVVGSDTPSTDPGNPPGYPCHMYLQPNNVPLLEYVANLDSIPPRGTTFVLGTMKVRGGSGGPTRIFALLDEDDADFFNSSVEVTLHYGLIFASWIFMHIM